MKDHFPLDIAFDDAFFNRLSEKKRLKDNILTNTHTMITSPRRYGKTSLVLKVLDELDEVGSASMDMMVASDTERMKNVILDGIGKAISTIVSGKSKLIELVRKTFIPFNTIETIELSGLSIRFYPYSAKAPHLIVLEALQRLEVLAEKLNKRVVLFFDEYQYVLEIKNALDFEASLRSFAQAAKQVVCVFSGSNRHMLQEVFSDRSRPFYNMCDHLLLGRISAQDYSKHLLKLSESQWHEKLDDNTLQTILEITARHSYYVNALCRRLWKSETLPDVNLVMSEWKQLALEKHYEINSDFEKLTPIQRTILIELAQEPFEHPTSKDVVKRLNASLSGINHAMEGLLERDYIYQTESGIYHVLNPLMEYVLRHKVYD
jgi:uncharacterized protein